MPKTGTQRFSQRLRLNQTAHFKTVFQDGKKLSSRYLALFVKSNELSYPRLGMVIGKRAVNQAVARQRIKRIVRESFRLHQQLLDSKDIVVVAYSGIAELDKTALRQQIDTQWERLFACKKV